MRLLTPAMKYWVCKSAPGFLYEAMECLGGNGYVEEGILARHYREAPVNAIWEGSGNVMCLDVLRALSREPKQPQGCCSNSPGKPAACRAQARRWRLSARPSAGRTSERVARLAVERLALLAAAAALNSVSPRHAELFAATRLAGSHADDVRRGRSRRRRYQGPSGSGAAVMCPAQDHSAVESRLMDSLYSRKPGRRDTGTPGQARGKNLEVLGHRVVGPVHLCRDVRRPNSCRRLVRVAAGRADRCGAPRSTSSAAA